MLVTKDPELAVEKVTPMMQQYLRITFFRLAL